MKFLRSFLLLAVLVAFVTGAGAKTVIYPVEAIDDFWKLNAEDFRQKYGGINITGLGVDDEGWYVRYRHENLSYYFGPLREREDARKKMWELEAIRDAVIRERASIASSKVDVVHFRYSDVPGARGDTPYTGKAGADGKGGDGKDGNGDGTGSGDGSDKDGGGKGGGKGGSGKDGDGSGKDGDGTGGSGDKDGTGTGGKDGLGGNGDQGGDGTGAFDQNGNLKTGGSQGGSGGGAGGQGGQKGGQSGGSSGQGGGQGGQSGGQSGGGGGAGGSPGSGSSGGGGNPLSLLAGLLRAILGL